MSYARRFLSTRWLTLLMMVLPVFPVMGTTAFAGLPGAVASRVKKIEKSLAAAEQALAAGRLQTAQRKLKETERPLKEIRSRYAGKFDENDSVFRAMIDHLTTVTSRVRAAERDAAGSAAAGAAEKAKHEALCKEWVDKLRPFVDRRSDKYLRIGSSLNAASPEEQARCKASYAEAQALFAKYRKVDFAFDKTRELKNVESSLSTALRFYGRSEARDARAASCKEWEDRLAPYVDPGMKSERKLIASATVDPVELERQQALYEEAKALFALYRKVEFPEGKSFRLKTLEENMTRTLEAFPEALAQSRAMMSGDVGKRLDRVLRHLDRDRAWKTSPTEKPPVLMERTLEGLRDAVDRYADTTPPDDETLAELRKKLEAVEKKNAEHKAVRAKRTFQQPDGYTGPELDQLKEKARAAAAHEGGEIVRVTVPSREWVVEDVVEFTDTSKTALRRRITRSLRAEVSLKEADGGAWLQGVYLGQDRLPDGTWGPLKAHTTWRDPMAPANLGKRQDGGKL